MKATDTEREVIFEQGASICAGLSALAEAAERLRPWDAAAMRAAEAWIFDVMNRVVGEETAEVQAAPASVSAVQAPGPTLEKHRHKFDDSGRCDWVGCAAKPRKKIAPPAPAPEAAAAAPAAEGPSS